VVTLHLSATYGFVRVVLGGSRALAVGLAQLLVMDTKEADTKFADRSYLTLIEQVLSLSELCAHLHVSAQTIYDLRSQGRGPREPDVVPAAIGGRLVPVHDSRTASTEDCPSSGIAQVGC